METGNVVYIGKKPVMAYCLAVMTAMRGDASH
jgi:DNA-binding protein Alba